MNVQNKLDFLQIQEVTTEKQKANGTREFKLPVRDQYGAAIHVASFGSGYVRRTKAGGYCPSWQLNKRIDSEPEYFNSGKKDSLGRPLYTQFTTRTCKLIPNEQDRIAYLISFCLKNYYINRANIVARSSDKYVPKWLYEYDLEETKKLHVWQEEPEVKVIVNGQRYNVI